MKDVVFNAQLVSWICIAAITLAWLKQRINSVEAFWSPLLIATPFLILGTVQKIFYFGDLFLPVLLFRYLGGTRRLPRLRFRRLNFPEKLAFILLVASPLVSSCFQMLFSDGFALDFMVLTIFRSFTAFFILISIRTDLISGRLSLRRYTQTAFAIMLIVCSLGALNYLNIFPSDILSVLGKTDSITMWTDGYGGGLVGMYRGEFGAYVPVLMALALPPLMKTEGGLFKAIIVLGLGAYCVFSVGSRQGIAGLVLLLGVLVAIGVSRRGTWKVAASSTVIGFLGIFAFTFLLSTSENFAVWVSDRFEVFLGSSTEIVAAVGSRDERMPEILREVSRNLDKYILGVGYGGFNDQLTPGSWRLTYVDSELLWVLQQNGIIGFFLYLLMIGSWLLNCRKRPPEEIPELKVMAYAACIVSIWFLYGHYVFLNWQTSHASVAYIHWVALALTWNDRASRVAATIAPRTMRHGARFRLRF